MNRIVEKSDPKYIVTGVFETRYLGVKTKIFKHFFMLFYKCYEIIYSWNI